MAAPLFLFAVASCVAAQTEDPYEVAGVQCSADDVPESRVRFRFVSDLNADGTSDYLLTMPPCGNAGCTFTAVLSSKDGYRTVGQLFFHPLAARIEVSDAGAGVIRAYVRQNAEAGSLVEYEISREGARVLSEQPMRPTSTDAEAYQALFGPAARAKAERGICLDPNNSLSWSPY